MQNSIGLIRIVAQVRFTYLPQVADCRGKMIEQREQGSLEFRVTDWAKCMHTLESAEKFPTVLK
jgi:hypothetical protein